MTNPVGITFLGAFAGATVDEDGEITVRLTVPKSEAANVAGLFQMAKRLGQIAFVPVRDAETQRL